MAILKKEEKNNPSTFFLSCKPPITTSSDTSYVRYEQKVHDMLKGIDFDVLAQLIAAILKRIQEARGRDLILLVGKTGAGKSTLLNYLMGCHFEFIEEGMDTQIEVAQGSTSYADIGHDSSESKTLLPQVVPTREFSEELAYVDLPGFRDTRSLEEGLASSVALPMVLQSAASVKGFIVVVDVRDLSVSRSQGFTDLLNLLGRLVGGKTPDSLLQQISFVFTHVHHIESQIDSQNFRDSRSTQIQQAE